MRRVFRSDDFGNFICQPCDINANRHFENNKNENDYNLS
jgi:hypothetical protein